jgi:hypothetical protein
MDYNDGDHPQIFVMSKLRDFIHFIHWASQLVGRLFEASSRESDKLETWKL